ncbi:MAG: single-stranded DNA-binding protein [Selenomonadaceae bacterium]
MNKVILMGRLARDPDVRSTQSGRTYARMTIAVDRRMSRNAAPGQQTADFINLVAWEQRAEFAGNYLHKGTKIVVEGRLQARSYDAQDGTKRYVTEVVVDNIEFAESKKSDTSASYGGGQSYGGAQSYGAPQSAQMPGGSAGGLGDSVSDDDIPF